MNRPREYVFEPSGQFSVGVSQNEITNLRESFDFTAEQFGNDDPDLSNFVFRSIRNNTQLRRFRNLEVGYNQTLAFLPDKFRGTTIGFTYARSYANRRSANLAPHRFIARLGYAYRRFSPNLGLTWRDNTPDSNFGRFYRHITQLTETAWQHGRDHHIIRVRQSLAPAVKLHMRAHELCRLILQAEARNAGTNRRFSTDESNRGTALREIESEISAVRRAVPAHAVDGLIDQLFRGLIVTTLQSAHRHAH